MKIISHKEFRLSDVSKSNDRRELNYLWGIYEKFLKERGCNPSVLGANHFLSKQVLENSIAFVASFSRKKDDLHMWSTYARGGVAIGFDQDKVIEWTERIHVYDGVYWTSNCKNVLSRFGDVKYYSANRLYKRIANKLRGSSSIIDPYKEFIAEAPFIKTNFWKTEKEWRIEVQYIIQDSINQSRLNGNEILFFYKNKEARAHIDVSFDPSMIKMIILAPDCDSNKDEIEEMLKRTGFQNANSVTVICSQGSLL